MRLRDCLLVLMLVLAPIVEGCGSREDEAKPRPTNAAAITEQGTSAPEVDDLSQVVVLTASEPTTLDPYFMVSIHPEGSVAAHIWDTLTWVSDDLDLEPRLAESWRLVDDLTWEVKLRQGVTFHNGEPFNAQVVKFSLERARELEGSLETFASDVELQSVEIVDDYTVHIRTAEPAVSMIYELSTVEMLPPTYYAQTAVKDLARSPVGSGPYRLANWDPGGRVVLEASAEYWQGAPTIHTLIFQAERDADRRLARLVDGDADLVTDLLPDQAESADTEHTRSVAIESTRRLFVGLRFQEGTSLADERFRQALNYAVDVPTLVSEFHAGYGQRYGSWVNPPNANPDLAPWPCDPDKARDLLAQVDYPEGLEIVMDVPKGRYYWDQEIAEAIAAQLSEVGIEVSVRAYDWSTYVHERLVPKETSPLFLLGLMSRGNGLEDTRNLAYDFPFNPTLWHNPEFEDLLNRAEKTFNKSLQLDLLHQAQVVAYEEAPWIWLWRPFLFYGVGQDLDWWQPRADGLIYLYTSTEVTGME